MPEYERAEQTIVRGSDFATSSKIPLRQLLHAAIDQSQGKIKCTGAKYLYITAQKYPPGRAGEKRRQQPKTGGDHL